MCDIWRRWEKESKYGNTAFFMVAKMDLFYLLQEKFVFTWGHIYSGSTSFNSNDIRKFVFDIQWWSNDDRILICAAIIEMKITTTQVAKHA